MTFTPFSQRNGYTIPTTIIKEDIPENVLNSVQNAFTEMLSVYSISPHIFDKMTAEFGRYYLNLRIANNQHKHINPLRYIDCEDLDWFNRIDVIEWMFDYLYKNLSIHEVSQLDKCIYDLNKEFQRHRYGYRIIKGLFIETTSDEEIACISNTITNSNDCVSIHIQRAAHSISPSNPAPDYRNSIKESISAVGSFLRKQFGGNTLGEALNNIKKKHVGLLHRFLIEAIEKLYIYTNQETTGIRHELISTEYIPNHSDALFMLVQACSIINYISNKLAVNDD